MSDSLLSMSEFVDSLMLGESVVASPELLEHARQVIERIDASTDEEPSDWIQRLADDIVNSCRSEVTG